MVQQEAVAAMLAAWRARGLQQRDPVPYHRLEALARRTEAQHGRVRALLEHKLAALLAQCAQRLAADSAAAATADSAAAATVGAAPSAAPGPLGQLVRRLAGSPIGPAPAADPAAAAAPAAGTGAAPVELKALRQHRRTWSRLHVERRLSQSKASAPDQAGPLHSQALVLRTLALMRELSPDYLDRFIAHVDALFWLEDAHGGSALLQKDVLRRSDEPASPEAPRGRKSARKRAAG